MNLKWIGIALVASIALGQSQTDKTSSPRFEVTSIRPNKSPDVCKALMQWLPSGRFIATNMPLMGVIATAWGLSLQTPRLRLASGVSMPDGIYDIEATSEKGMFPPGVNAEARFSTMKLMVQVLLEERFKLRVRKESKEEPVYALVVGRGGLKLEKSRFQEPNCNEEFGPKFFSNPGCHWLDGGQDAGLHGGSVTVASVVDYVNNFTDRPLFDKTGLTGFYNFQTEGWAPMKLPPLQSCDASPGNSERPSLPDVFEKLGLHMESQKAVIDMFVIDQVERPSEN